MDSPGQMGAPFSEGKQGVCLWSRVEADPPLAASIPAASTLYVPSLKGWSARQFPGSARRPV